MKLCHVASPFGLYLTGSKRRKTSSFIILLSIVADRLSPFPKLVCFIAFPSSLPLLQNVDIQIDCVSTAANSHLFFLKLSNIIFSVAMTSSKAAVYGGDDALICMFSLIMIYC